MQEACELASRALIAGPDNSTCLASAAYVYAVLANQFTEALDLVNRALILHPNSVLVRNRVAAVFVVCGETDKTIAECEAARRMNPLDTKKAATFTYNVLSAAFYLRTASRRASTRAGVRWHSRRRPMWLGSTSPHPSPNSAA